MNPLKLRATCLETAGRVSSDIDSTLRHAGILEVFVVCGYQEAQRALDALRGMIPTAPPPAPPAPDKATNDDDALPGEGPAGKPSAVH